MKLLKVFLGLSVLTSLQASSLIKVECDVSGEEIYLDGKFKTECESGELVKLLAPAGRHTLKAVKHNKDGSYYKFVKTFRLGDGVEKVISVNSKINYTEKYYYKKAFDSLKDAKVYLEKYPNGKYVKEIKNYWDKKYFSKCDTIYGCQDYLNNISWGKYKTSAKNRIEKYYFQRSNDINGCETYLEKYPNGKYAKKIRKKLEKMYYERAKNDIDYADKYVKFFPKGKNISYIKNIRDNYYWTKCQDLKSCKIYVKKVPYGKHIKEAKEIVKNTWFKTYGGNKKDELWIHSFVETKDGYVLAGYSKSYSNGGEDGWIFKIDKNGNKLWQNHFGGKKDDEFNAIVKTDNGFIVSGWSESVASKSKGWILKVDKNGNYINQNHFGVNSSGFVDIIQFNNIFVNVGSKDKHFWILSIDNYLNKVGENSYKYNNNGEDFFSIIYTNNGGFVAVGDSYYNSKFCDGAIFKFNNRHKEWVKILKNHNFSSIIEAKNGYIVVGSTKDDNNFNGSIIKIDKNGNKIWEKTFGGKKDDEFASIVKMKNGYIVSGWTWSKGNGKDDVWLIKIDENGNKIWEKTFGGKGIDFTWGLFKGKEGNLIIPATTYSYGAGNGDAWVIKISKELLKKWDEDAKATK